MGYIQRIEPDSSIVSFHKVEGPKWATCLFLQLGARGTGRASGGGGVRIVAAFAMEKDVGRFIIGVCRNKKQRCIHFF